MTWQNIQPGDCLASLEAQHGVPWQAIWASGENAELRTHCPNPNALPPDGLIYLPDKRKVYKSGSTDRRHSFRLNQSRTVLRLRLLDNHRPRANQRFELVVDGGQTIEGQTDAEGRLETPIPRNARRGRLTLYGEQRHEVYRLDLGRVAPRDTIAGAKSRLHNLGYRFTDLDDRPGPELTAALRDFQRNNDLDPTGELDTATAAKLVDCYGG